MFTSRPSLESSSSLDLDHGLPTQDPTHHTVCEEIQFASEYSLECVQNMYG